jgi:hypothetical protein
MVHSGGKRRREAVGPWCFLSHGRSSPGSLAKFVAIRRASSRVSRLVAMAAVAMLNMCEAYSAARGSLSITVAFSF